MSLPNPGGVTTRDLLGTPVVLTDYAGLLAQLPAWAAAPAPVDVDFSNTQIVAMRRLDPAFREATRACDYYIPDGMPLIFCLRLMGVKLRDRVYGPTFMRRALEQETRLRHYFLGGSPATLEKLVARARQLSGSRFQLVGSHHGYFKPGENAAILEEINRLSPDVVWIGLGTPKQQHWVRENKAAIRRGLLLNVGFAFDVNAGTKRDAPLWMQRLALTWVFRISQEPGRLLGRYFKYNSWFVWFCLVDFAAFLVRKLTGTSGPQSAP